MSNGNNGLSADILAKLQSPDASVRMAAMGAVMAAPPVDTRVWNPTVERTGDTLVIPDGAYLPDVIDTLRRQHSREEQVVRVHVKMDVSPWDGAIALQKAIEQNLGVLIQKTCQCGDPNCGSHQMEVEVELGRTIQVPWGSFELPGMEDAEVTTETKTENGQMVFACTVRCKRRYEDRIRRLLETARQIAGRESIHRGKAFSIAFHDEDGDRIPMPKPTFFQFMDEEPVFRQTLHDSIERNVFVPMRHADDLRSMGQTLKRGILFAGKYGVGKTLLASHIAREAVKAGWTFIYVKDSEELTDALIYAQKYQPVIVFAEDVDRVAGRDRTDDVNDILNQLDGVDSKSAAIMTVLTTNHPENINDAMRRPGRIDLVMEVLPPDAETVIRMVNRFAGASLKAGSDLTEVAMVLDGESPAKVRETIGRAKLEVLRRTGNPRSKITSADLLVVAQEVKAEGDLFNSTGKKTETVTASDFAQGVADLASRVGRRATNGSGAMLPS